MLRAKKLDRIGIGDNFKRGYTCIICFDPEKPKEADRALYYRISKGKPKYPTMQESIIATQAGKDHENYTYKYSGFVDCPEHGIQEGIPRTQKTKVDREPRTWYDIPIEIEKWLISKGCDPSKLGATKHTTYEIIDKEHQ